MEIRGIPHTGVPDGEYTLSGLLIGIDGIYRAGLLVYQSLVLPLSSRWRRCVLVELTLYVRIVKMNGELISRA